MIKEKFFNYSLLINGLKNKDFKKIAFFTGIGIYD